MYLYFNLNQPNALLLKKVLSWILLILWIALLVFRLVVVVIRAARDSLAKTQRSPLSYSSQGYVCLI